MTRAWAKCAACLGGVGHAALARMAQHGKRLCRLTLARGRNEDGNQLPFLSTADVIRQARSGRLPRQFRTKIEGEALGPVLKAGAVATVTRRPAQAGAIVCVAENDRLVWRRVVCVKDGKALLRNDIAPFADGWFEEIVGCADVGRLLQIVAQKFPRFWTQASWWGHRLWIRLINLPRRWRARLHSPAIFRVRRLAEEDLEAFRAFCGSVCDEPREDCQLPDPERAVVFGLWAESGALVGTAKLVLRGDEAYCFSAVVHPRFRNRGGATELLREAVREAEWRGLRRVFAYVAARNLHSLKVCERAGFRLNGKWWHEPTDRFLASEKQLLEVEAVLGGNWSLDKTAFEEQAQPAPQDERRIPVSELE